MDCWRLKRKLVILHVGLLAKLWCLALQNVLHKYRAPIRQPKQSNLPKSPKYTQRFLIVYMIATWLKSFVVVPKTKIKVWGSKTGGSCRFFHNFVSAQSRNTSVKYFLLLVNFHFKMERTRTGFEPGFIL